MTTKNAENSEKPQAAVASSDLLAGLRATSAKLSELGEAARGPGKHSVFMTIREARYHCDDAIFAAVEWIAANTELSGGGPLSNKTTEAESRRPLE